MTRLDTTQRAALGNWWTLASDAASAGYTSTDLITAASAIAAQAGRSLAFAESSAIATLYGYARRMDNAAGVLQSAPGTAVIDPSMIGVPPWARDEQVMNTTPIWHATFEFTYLDQAGNAQTDFRTSVFEMTMADTVSGLLSDVTDDAQAMADKYNVRLVSVKLHSILAV